MFRAIKRAALLVPPIRKLKQQRDEAIARRTEDLENRLLNRALSAVREEFTPLPRFAYHLPLDHEMRTLPPQFDPPVWVPGEILPLPPSGERHGHDDSKYLEWGKYDHDQLLGHIRRELPSTDNLSIMDFGCSSGRVLRHFLPEARERGWKLTGVDVSARRIEWMRRNFPPEFQVYAGSALPILPFESNSFDVIYGLSVFTHMKYLWDMWLLEMRRVLKPGGLLIQTIHTENAWRFFSQHQNEAWARNALGPMIVQEENLPCDFVYFGNIAENQVFWKKEIAVEFWSRYFADVTIYPPPPEYWYQDWAVCRKPQPAASTATAHPAAAPAVRVHKDYSQFGEQEIILDFFSRLPAATRYCVDAGAYDGVIGSNSRALLLNGWSGILIEPNPRAFVRLQALYAGRPDVICVQKAISDKSSDAVPMKFCAGPPGTAEEDKWKFAQPSTLYDSFAAEFEKEHGYVYETSMVATDTLENILHECGAPAAIGFLSIDCEGEDMSIVKRFDFQTFRPQLICLEAEDTNRHFYTEVLEPRGYTVHAYTRSNTFYKPRTS